MTALTFCKQQRLLKPAEFKRVFDNPIKKIHSQHLIAFVQTGEHQPRLGLAITKKKLKLAVMRNQLKRLTREHFRLNAHKLGAVDVVLIVKMGYAKGADLNTELDEIFAKLTMLYPACDVG